MTILLSDPRVASVPVHETYQPLVTLGASFGPARARVRAAVAARLRRAQMALPVGMRLCVVDGHRSTAPHVTGGAVDVTLADLRGVELDLGTPMGATPEDSGGRCYLDAPDVPAAARDRRAILARVLHDAGLVNCPAQWWHWSYGDRYWALVTGAHRAVYGPVRDLDGPPDDGGGPLEDITWGSLRRAA